MARSAHDSRRRRPLPASQVEAKPGKRRCGDCTACCHSMAITELDKPEWASCPNQRTPGLTGRGCGSYHDRPASCRVFACLWLQGFSLTREEHRPDRCGVMLAATDNPRVVQARELWPGATTSGDGLALVTALRRAGVRVAIVAPGSVAVLQPLTVFGTPTH